MDVLFVDQHLGHPEIEGIELLRRAAEAGYDGYACIVTASTREMQVS